MKKILFVAVKDLPISESLRIFMQHQELENIFELVINHSASTLLSKDGFTNQGLIELYQLLKKHNLTDLLQE